MSSLVKVSLHDELGDFMKRKVWELRVTSVAEAIHAINTMSGGKLFKYLSSEDNKSKEYEVTVNNKKLEVENNLSDSEKIKESELMLRYESLETIDISPSISGSGKNALGIVLIVVAVALIATGIGAAAGAAWATGITGTLGVSTTSLIVAGLGLAAAGALILLSKPPKFEPFGTIDQGQRDSYLFNGPLNTVSEGGPVPIGYGELIVGSNVIAQSLQVKDFIIRNEENFNVSENGIVIIDKASQYDWAIGYVNNSDGSGQFQSDLDEFTYWNENVYKAGRGYWRPDWDVYQRLYWAKYFIYWYEVQNQVSSISNITQFYSEIES